MSLDFWNEPMKKRIISFCTLLFILLGGISYYWHYRKTEFYVLAIGICPPWKPEITQKICKNAIDSIISTLKTHSKIPLPDSHIKILLDADATYKGLGEALSWMQQQGDNNDIHLIFGNFHAGATQPNTDTLDEAHENIVLWTEEVPFSTQAAIIQKQWIVSSELRDAINSIPGKKIVIIDACESEIIEEDLMRREFHSVHTNPQEAVIVSAGSEQLAHLNLDITMALFTDQLIQAIQNGAKNLEEAFNVAQPATQEAAIENCKKMPDYEYLKKAYHERACPQKPHKKDPEQILKLIEFKTR